MQIKAKYIDNFESVQHVIVFFLFSYSEHSAIITVFSSGTAACSGTSAGFTQLQRSVTTCTEMCLLSFESCSLHFFTF